MKNFSNYELYVLLDTVFHRRYEAREKIEQIEEGRKNPSEYDYWNKIYNDTDKIYTKLINIIYNKEV